jgi:hydroxymethylglutaryl-CoA lyase
MTSLRICDISPRLVFQAQPASTAQKIELVDRIINAGVPAVEVSSFMRPDLIPGLADAEQVFEGVARRPGVDLECVVGNLRGLERACGVGADGAWFSLSVDEGFSVANIGRSIEQSFAELARLQAYAENHPVNLGVCLVFAFGGPTGLAKTPSDVEPFLRRLLADGVRRFTFADSYGYAAPSQVVDMLAMARSLSSEASYALQVHDSRGMGLADVAAFASIGELNIDTSLAGAGGHPAMPSAPLGGVATEDAVQMLELMGYQTGIDLRALIDTANWLETALGAPQKGYVRHTGPVPTDPYDVYGPTSFRWK